MVSTEKKRYRGIARTLSEKFSPSEIAALSAAFDSLVKAFPEERHFVIEFAQAYKGQGEKVWLIIDESATQLMETMMFPVDY